MSDWSATYSAAARPTANLSYPQQHTSLRILAFTVNTGFRSPIADRHVRKICSQLNVDHIEFRADRIFRKLFQYGFRKLDTYGFSFVDSWAGELIQDIGRNFAASLEVPIVVLGYTPEQIEAQHSQSALDIPPAEADDDYGLYPSGGYILKCNQQFNRTHYGDIHLVEVFDEYQMRYWWNHQNWSTQQIPTMVLPFQAFRRHIGCVVVNKGDIGRQVRHRLRNDRNPMPRSFPDFGHEPNEKRRRFHALCPDGIRDD